MKLKIVHFLEAATVLTGIKVFLYPELSTWVTLAPIYLPVILFVGLFVTIGMLKE